MIFSILRLLYGETSAGTPPPAGEPPTSSPAEKTIPESELKRLLEEERERIRIETAKQFEEKLIPDEILETTDMTYDELISFLQESVEDVEDEEEDEGEEESEELKALREQYEKEIEQRDREIEARSERETKVTEELKVERIDNAIKNELLKRGARTPDLIVLALKDSITFDKNNQPIVVNEKGEPRVRTIEETKDGVRKFNTVDMSIADLVGEFLDREENQHFLPASPKKGSGISATGPVGSEFVADAKYQQALEEARKTGRVSTDFLKAWQEKYHSAAKAG